MMNFFIELTFKNNDFNLKKKIKLKVWREKKKYFNIKSINH